MASQNNLGSITLLNKVAGEERSEGEIKGINITEDAENTDNVEGVKEAERMKGVEITEFQEIESYFDQAISVIYE
ncbi:hypothetical protein RhiirA5_407044 [Rhizophagus irregularis]|uniref:Uncharacterized protein n=1 Tax=Rhizophagus irregularis TaxID=588596 RepID=A0A2N0QBI8_9GLOM|nr:hypothetical protein RhiirA5_407044 [Rhizophagus irregularis]